MIRARRTNPLSISLVVLLAACGGPPTAASPGASTVDPGPSSDPDGTTPVPAPSDVVPCELLGDEEIADIVDGATVASMIDTAQDTVYANHCRWTLEDASGGMLGQIDLGVVSPEGRALYDESFAILGWDRLDGLPADEAIRDPNAGGIVAVSGDVFVDVFTLFLSDEQERAVAEVALENIAAR